MSKNFVRKIILKNSHAVSTRDKPVSDPVSGLSIYIVGGGVLVLWFSQILQGCKHSALFSDQCLLGLQYLGL